MLRTILAVGRVFDWISPTLAGIMSVAYGPSHRLHIPQACGWTGGEIVRLLRRHGIATWGHMIIKQTFIITVKKKQARWAEYVLARAGVPIGFTPARGTLVSSSQNSVRHHDPQTNRGLSGILKEVGDLRLF